MTRDDRKKPLSREALAMAEVGHTDIRPAVAWFLVVMFLAVILGVPLVEQLARPTLRDVADILPSASDAPGSDVLAGPLGRSRRINALMLRNITQFEDTLEKESIVAEAVIPPMQGLLVGLLGAGTESAYCGRDGWLFFRPGIDYLTGRGFLDERVLLARSRGGDEWHQPPQPDPIRAIVEFRDHLAARGITLILMPAPIKPMIYPEQFSGAYDGRQPLQNFSYVAFKVLLEQEGVLLCDVTESLMAEKGQAVDGLYLKTDTHWSPRGMELAARAMADFITSRGLLSGSARAGYLADPKEITSLGDIAATLDLPVSTSVFQPETVTTRRVMDANGAPWEASADADVLLLGDSFANIFALKGMGWGESAGLAEHLSLALDGAVDAIRINDNGAYATRQHLSRLMEGGEDRLDGKRVVIWEFAMRELAVGDWQTGLGNATSRQ
jgi:alginate O-acetyltransferase complex protein AlgJ